MRKDELRVPDYLAHILQAIERIGTYTDDIDVPVHGIPVEYTN